MDPTRCECATWAREAADTLPEHHPSCPCARVRVPIVGAPKLYYPEAVTVLNPAAWEDNAPPPRVSWRRLRRLLNRLLRATRGGCELPKPPIGYRPQRRPGLAGRLAYRVRRAVWWADMRLSTWSERGRPPWGPA